jgi:F5/8 type C domain
VRRTSAGRSSAAALAVLAVAAVVACSPDSAPSSVPVQASLATAPVTVGVSAGPAAAGVGPTTVEGGAGAPAGDPAISAVEHWVTTGPAPGGGTELVDRRTGSVFVPRGVSLLKDEAQTSGPYPILDMLVAPGHYDDHWTRARLRQLARLGYTTVRVWLDHCPGDCLTNPDGSAKAAWLDNVTALLQAARDTRIAVMLVSNELPEVGYADQLPSGGVFDGGFDATILSSQGVALTRTYWRTIIGGLQARGAPLQAVLAYELLNETFFELDRNPLALTSGTVTTANGMTYDMADQAARDAMVDEGQVYWADQAAATIHQLDPDALVTLGFFPPTHDTRLVRSAYFVQHANVDFVDAHHYPGMASYLADDIDAMGLTGYTAKPVVLGEMGAFRLAYPDAMAGAAGLAGLQATSCDAGIDGWLTWVMGSLDDSIIPVEEGKGAILKVLSPARRPDPCAPGPTANLALRQRVTATATDPGSRAAWAVDGLAVSSWSAGDFPPQAITIDLGHTVTLHELRLLTAQYPDGATTHVVEVRGQGGGWKVVHTFDGTTTDPEWLRWRPRKAPSGIRYLRVTTTSSPSWVGWREIQVY